VIYYDARGGYIDNVPATFERKDTDLGIGYAVCRPMRPGNARMAGLTMAFACRRVAQ